MHRTSLILLTLLALAACGEDTGGDDDDTAIGDDDDTAIGDDDDTSSGDDDTSVGDDDDDDDDDDDTVLPDCSDQPLLEILAVDAWGRAVSSSQGQPPTVAVPGAHQLILTAVDHHDAQLDWEVDGAGQVLSASVAEPALLARSTDQRAVEGWEGSCPVQTLYVGLDHRWFSSEAPRPWREGNDVELLMDGEDFWAEVDADLHGAQDFVHWSTWWWQSDFELVRPAGHYLMSESEREVNTIDSVLTTLPGVRSRLLVNRFCGGDCWDLFDWLNTDDALEQHGDDPYDLVEVALQTNTTEVPVDDPIVLDPITFDFTGRVADQPGFAGRDFLDGGGAARDLDVPAASYHQKLVSIDGRVAFVSGMNTKSTDWDSSEHRVFDERRMEFDADADAREDVYYEVELPDLGPRKDYGVRVEGPLAADVDVMLHQRWQQALADQQPYTENTTDWSPPPPSAPLMGGVAAQFVVTMPGPVPERSILETMVKACTEADDYIFVEDQYWRVPLLNATILNTLLAKPWVQLVVVTKPVTSYDGGAYWTVEADTLFKDQVPGQYRTFQLRSFDYMLDDGYIFDTVEPQLQDMDVHSKIMLVDDRYLAVGSANKNNRGLLYEGEADVVVLDEVFVTEARERIFANLLGPDYAPLMGPDVASALTVMDGAAVTNQDVVDWWDDNAGDMELDDAPDAELVQWPSGFLYPLDLGDDWWVQVGPDTF